MVGGQAIDLGSVSLKLDQKALEHMHRHKTGALIEVSVHLGALASGRAEAAQLAALQTLCTGHWPGFPGAGRHSRRRKRYRHPRQTPGRRHRPRQADLPGPARPRRRQGLRPGTARSGPARPATVSTRRPSLCAIWPVISSNAATETAVIQPISPSDLCVGRVRSHQVNCRIFYTYNDSPDAHDVS